jgi:hypothetical protein
VSSTTFAAPALRPGLALKRPRPALYHQLLAGVLLANLAAFALDPALADVALVNLAAAVLVRQQRVLNVIFGVAGRGSREWPLWVRSTVSRIHHIGGIHAGAALAGTAWFAAFTYDVVTGPADATTRGLALALVVLTGIVCAGAAPPVRARAHNVFENTHRFGGWTAVGVFWALTIHTHAAGDWQVWLLAVVTASIASPWLRLRRVPVTVERPSSHAAIVTFGGRTPATAAAVGISRSPLREWHAFAAVTSPDRPGHRLLVSRAGDWTGRFIDDPPSHLWVRGIPVAAPMAKVSVLYERVVYVVTGSGIGPCLGQILAARVPARLVWSTRAPRATYGDALVDEVRAAQPDALIWDTTERGKPDLEQLALEAVRDFEAEAVFIVSNRPTTTRLVDALERRGIPAFGPIWDS